MTISVRARLALFVLAALLLCGGDASASNASRLRLALGRTAGGGSVNASVSMFTTESRNLSAEMATALAGATGSELITVSQTGGIDCKVWPDQLLTWGTWRKRELLDEFICDTTGATPGTQAGLLTIVSSAGTYKIGVDVVGGDRTDFKFGARSWPRFGGYPITTLLSGFSSGVTTITAVTDNVGANRLADNLFEIINNHLTVACTGTLTQCPTATTSGTPIVQSGHDPCEYFPSTWPAIPTGLWHVTLHNSVSLKDVTLNLTMAANQIDIAVMPTWVTTNNVNGGPAYPYGQIEMVTGGGHTLSRCRRYFGDTVMAEGYKAAPSLYSTPSVGSVWYTGLDGVGPAAIAAPVQPDDPGFVTFKPREPHQGAFGHILIRMDGTPSTGVDETVTYGGVGYKHHPTFTRWTEWDLTSASPDGGIQGSLGVSISTAGNQWAYTQVDHNKARFFNFGGNNPHWDGFVIHNELLYNGPVTIQYTGFDGVLHGNWLVGGYPYMVRGDMVDTAMLDDPTSPVVARFNYNHYKDIFEAPDGCTSHADLHQSILSDNVYMTAWASASGAAHQGYQVIGNVFSQSNVHGYNSNIDATTCATRPVDTSGTKYASSPQNLFISGSPDTSKIDYQFIGNLIENGSVYGVAVRDLGDNTIIKYNMGHYPYYIQDCTHGGLCLTPLQFTAVDPYIHLLGASGLPDLDYNVFTVAPSSETNGYTFITAPTMTAGTHDVYNATAASFVQASAYTVTTHTIQDIFDRNQMVTPTGGPEFDHNEVDIRGETFDAGLLIPNTVRHSPYCSVPPVATKSWSTSPVNGDTVTITTPGTYGNSPTSTLGDRWTLYDATAAVAVDKGTGTTVTLNSADVARVGTVSKPVSIYYTQGKANADGSGQCVSNVIQLSP